MSIHQNKKVSNLNCSNSSYDAHLKRNKASLSLNSSRAQKATDNSNINAELVESEQTQPKVKALKILLSNENVSLYPTPVNSHLISEIALKSDALKRSPNMMLSDYLKSFYLHHFISILMRVLLLFQVIHIHQTGLTHLMLSKRFLYFREIILID